MTHALRSKCCGSHHHQAGVHTVQMSWVWGPHAHTRGCAASGGPGAATLQCGIREKSYRLAAVSGDRPRAVPLCVHSESLCPTFCKTPCALGTGPQVGVRSRKGLEVQAMASRFPRGLRPVVRTENSGKGASISPVLPQDAVTGCVLPFPPPGVWQALTSVQHA